MQENITHNDRNVIVIKEDIDKNIVQSEVFSFNETLINVITAFGKNRKFNNGVKGNLYILVPFKEQDL